MSNEGLHTAILCSAIIGVLGFSAMSWLFPAIAWLFAGSKRKMMTTRERVLPVKKIAIVMPAHNEERTLVETLPSMRAAIAHLQRSRPEIQVDIRIGADGCKDRTVEIGRSFGAEVVESVVSRGKWRTVHELVRSSTDADWIVLSDAGILWPENFLTGCLPYWEDADAIGVAPTYRNPTAGLVEKFIWNFECWLKTMENSAGGPVSVHGPTVTYRRSNLLATLDALSATGTSWINDDVAITLYLRLMEPGKKVIYLPSIASWDCAASHIEASGAPIREFNRRKRMVLGNIQWLKQILIPQWRKNPLAALVTLRRIFRIIWAYWIIAFVLIAAFGLGFMPFLILTMAGGGIGIAIVGARPLLMLADSCFVSLAAPYYLVSGQGLSRWK
jgi:cellulose synthase/poly-beta-1,6-N-acetylglucosamine synthase-like glycosyltransferase